MKIVLQRDKTTDRSTIGSMNVDHYHVVTLEDGKRDHKVWGETCIPAGTYKLELRTSGGMTQRYANRYDFHRGMIWLRHVPEFEFVYIHVGNTPADTLGCILVGLSSGEDMIYGSRKAYEAIYTKIADAIESDEGCTLTVKN